MSSHPHTLRAGIPTVALHLRRLSPVPALSSHSKGRNREPPNETRACYIKINFFLRKLKIHVRVCEGERVSSVFLQFVIVQFIFLITPCSGGHPKFLLHHPNDSIQRGLADLLRHRSRPQQRMMFWI